jgi:hypothetical protein
MTFNKVLKSVVEVCFADGKVTEPSGSIAGYGVRTGSEKAECLKLLTELTMLTDYFKADTKNYLANKYATFRNVGSINGTAKNPHTTRSGITYDLNKLKRSLGEDSLANIVRSRDGAELSGYITKINSLLDKHRGKSLISGLSLRIKDTDGKVAELTEREYELLHTICFQFAKVRTANVEKIVGGRMASYMKYLDCNRNSLQGENLKRYEELKGIIEASSYRSAYSPNFKEIQL